MRVYVVWDEVSEQVEAVFSTQEAAIAACEALDQKMAEAGYDVTHEAWHVWEEFELDKQPEALS